MTDFRIVERVEIGSTGFPEMSYILEMRGNGVVNFVAIHKFNDSVTAKLALEAWEKEYEHEKDAE